ncbi:MAG: GAF domain-containing protein, partial [Spirochaetales bacterium]|nr:GAF domain-containing protein [Spirochaetales bacterium]
RNPEIINSLPSKDGEILSNLIDRWFANYETSYLELFKKMDIIIASPFMVDYQGMELSRILTILYTFGIDGNDDLQLVFEFEGLSRNVRSSINRFISDLDTEIISISDYITKEINKGMIIATIVSLLTIILSLIIITSFSRRMGIRIILMRDAIKSLSLGDFSHELHIESGDEFESFSNHFNVFKNELWEKLDSVLDFMLEISDSISVESNLEKVLEIVADSAVKNTAADAGSIFLVDELDDSMIKQKIAIGLLPPLFNVPSEYTKDMEKLVEIIINTPILTGETIIGRAVETGNNFFIRDVLTEKEMKQNQEEGSLLYISSIMVVPLIITGRVLGVIVLSKNRPGEKFTDIDFNHI